MQDSQLQQNDAEDDINVRPNIEELFGIDSTSESSSCVFDTNMSNGVHTSGNHFAGDVHDRNVGKDTDKHVHPRISDKKDKKNSRGLATNSGVGSPKYEHGVCVCEGESPSGGMRVLART